MDNKEKKDKGIAIAGTIVVHALLLLVLLFMAFKMPSPLPEEEGVEVDLGMMDQGMGEIQPEQSAVPMAPQSQPQPQSNNDKEETVTENNPDNPSIDNTRTPKPRQEQNVQNPTPNPRAMYQGSNNPQSGGSEGITGQPGDQGNPNGLAGVHQYDGNGGRGNGVSAYLGNRRTRYLPSPPKVDTEQEIIKVEIRVDRSGRVVSQRIADGYRSTTSRANQELALQLASRTTFEPDDNAPEEQIGSITYTFTY